MCTLAERTAMCSTGVLRGIACNHSALLYYHTLLPVSELLLVIRDSHHSLQG
jgi:hypothetical protein